MVRVKSVTILRGYPWVKVKHFIANHEPTWNAAPFQSKCTIDLLKWPAISGNGEKNKITNHKKKSLNRSSLLRLTHSQYIIVYIIVIINIIKCGFASMMLDASECMHIHIKRPKANQFIFIAYWLFAQPRLCYTFSCIISGSEYTIYNIYICLPFVHKMSHHLDCLGLSKCQYYI